MLDVEPQPLVSDDWLVTHRIVMRLLAGRVAGQRSRQATGTPSLTQLSYIRQHTTTNCRALWKVNLPFLGQRLGTGGSSSSPHRPTLDRRAESGDGRWEMGVLAFTNIKKCQTQPRTKNPAPNIPPLTTDLPHTMLTNLCQEF